MVTTLSPRPQLPRNRTVARYGLAVAVLVVAVTSQYFVPSTVPPLRPVYGSLLGDVLIVYAIPIAAFAVLVGSAPLQRWRGNLEPAAAGGLG